MPFPKRLLLEGETVALDLRPHWWFFAGPLFAGIPVVALVLLVALVAILAPALKPAVRAGHNLAPN